MLDRILLKVPKILLIGILSILWGGGCSSDPSGFFGGRRDVVVADSVNPNELASLNGRWREAIGLANAGAFRDAETILTSLLTEELHAQAPLLESRLMLALGEIHLARRQIGQAKRLLTRVREDGQEDPSLQSAALSALAQLERGAGHSAGAYLLDLEAVRFSLLSSDLRLRFRTQANAGRGALEIENWEAAEEWLTGAARILDGFGGIGVIDRLQLGESLAKLSRFDPPGVAGLEHDRRAGALRLRAFEVLHSVIQLEPVDEASIAFAYLALGKLYADENRFAEALESEERAGLSAQRAGEESILQQSHHLRAGYLAAQNRIEEALLAYQESFSILAMLPTQADSGFANHSRSFQSGRGAFYRDYVTFLLDRADSIEDGHDADLLREVRSILESQKTDELRDYFGEACVERSFRTTRSVDDMATGGVLVVYPIVLDNRLELIVTYEDGIERFTIPVSRKEVQETARAFRRSIENAPSREYLRPAQSLYDWLVRPYEHRFRDRDATLVFVPDETLRSIPISAMSDGQEFLIEKVATAIVPALTLIDPKRVSLGEVKVLAGGLSDATQGFPALPNVRGELEWLESRLGAKVLIDEDFTLRSWQNAVESNRWSVLHIATHAEFRENSRESFLLTHDGRVELDRFEELIGQFETRDQPLELLTLSACETAVGSDRAGLGLAGVAVLSGARSVLGTLWTVDDVATARLMESFYSNLLGGDLSRAESLRSAKISLLSDGRLDHPAFWSSFVLINNWM